MTHPVTPALTVIWTRARGEPRNRQAHTLLRCPTGPSNINAPRMFEYIESKRRGPPIRDLHPLESLTGLSGGGESERRAPKIRGSYTLREPNRPLTRREPELEPPNQG